VTALHFTLHFYWKFDRDIFDLSSSGLFYFPRARARHCALLCSDLPRARARATCVSLLK